MPCVKFGSHAVLTCWVGQIRRGGCLKTGLSSLGYLRAGVRLVLEMLPWSSSLRAPCPLVYVLLALDAAVVLPCTRYSRCCCPARHTFYFACLRTLKLTRDSLTQDDEFQRTLRQPWNRESDSSVEAPGLPSSTPRYRRPSASSTGRTTSPPFTAMQVLQRQAEHPPKPTNQERPQHQRNQGQDPDSFCGAIGAGSEPLPAPARKTGAVEGDDQGKKTLLSVFFGAACFPFWTRPSTVLLLVVAVAAATVFSVFAKLGIILDASSAVTKASKILLSQKIRFAGYAGKGWLAHIFA